MMKNWFNKLIGKRIVGTIPGNTMSTETGKVYKIAFHLFESKFGRSYKAVGFDRFWDSPEAHPIFSLMVYPWLHGRDLKCIYNELRERNILKQSVNEKTLDNKR